MKTTDFPISQVDLAIGKDKRLELSRDLMNLAKQERFSLSKRMSFELIKANHTKNKEFANPDNSECWQKYLQSLYNEYEEHKTRSIANDITIEEAVHKFDKARLCIFNSQLLMSLLRTKKQVSVVSDGKLEENVVFEHEPYLYVVNWKDIIILSAIYSAYFESHVDSEYVLNDRVVWDILFPNKKFESGFIFEIEKSVGKFRQVRGVYSLSGREYEIDDTFYFDGSVDVDSGIIQFVQPMICAFIQEQQKRMVRIEQSYLKGRERTLLKQQLWSYLVFRWKTRDATPISISWLCNGREGKATPTIEHNYNSYGRFKQEFLFVTNRLKKQGLFPPRKGKSHNLDGNDNWTWEINKGKKEIEE